MMWLTFSVDQPEPVQETLVNKFIDFLNAFGETPEGNEKPVILSFTHRI